MLLRIFHDLRRHEEGQALVLAAISMLVLSLCVLATVNLSYVASERIRLQNTADNAAYTMAAHQARALNYFAYTNRAMVVHYASQMNMISVLSYMMFSIIVLSLLSFLPYIGQVMQIIANIYKIIVNILDIAASTFSVLIDGATYLLGMTQLAVSTGMLTRVVSGASAEVRRTNTDYVVEPIAATMLGIDAGARWSQTVNTNFFPTLGTVSTPERAFMTEIANSARHEWTAYGGQNGRGWNLLGGLPRRANFSLGFPGFGISLGKFARTEWGSLAPGTGGGGIGGGIIGGIIGGLLGNLLTITEQGFSSDTFQLRISLGPVRITFSTGAEVWADRRLGGHRFFFDDSYSPRWLSAIAKPFMRPIVSAANAAIQSFANGMHGGRDGMHFPVAHFHFGQLPYAHFKPEMNRLGSDWFKQPPSLAFITLPTAALLSKGRPFMTSFEVRLGALHSASSKLAAENGLSTAQLRNKRGGYRSGLEHRPGDTFMGLQEGFHAMAAARAYYHRPGDWREPPNLFNPFWGAKLIPVGDYPAIQNSALFRNLFRDSLVVH